VNSKIPETQRGVRPTILFGVVALTAAAVALTTFLVSRGCDDGRAEESEADAEEFAEDDFFEFSDSAAADRALGTTPRAIPTGPLPRLPEHIRARVVLDSLGAEIPSLTPEQIVATLQQNRAAMRECVRGAGGFRALRGVGAPAGQGGVADAGVRARPRMRFDIAPNGHVVPGSVSLEPSGPDGLAACVADVLSGTTFPATGGDGAHVEMPLGLGRGGRRRLDGGAGSGGRRTRGGNAGGEDRSSGGATVPAIAPP
jgi:hypothetical protein